MGGVTLNSPTFPEVTMHLGKHTLRVIAPGAPARLYVRSVQLNGAPIRNWWIAWEQLSKASQLEFALDSRAANQPGQPPPSFAPSR